MLQELKELFAGNVAPHEGAWIEIDEPSAAQGVSPVAPHEGAWIEICRR